MDSEKMIVSTAVYETQTPRWPTSRRCTIGTYSASTTRHVGSSFTVDASPSNAVDVFYHPFAYGIAKV